MSQKNKEFSLEVFYSTDYSKFKILNGNREIDALHVKRLIESFRENYLFSPILVNSKHEVIDGQNRFTAAKALGLPIYYLVAYNYGLKEVQILNTNTSNWQKEDYLNMYCKKKSEPYLQMRKFMEDFPSFGISATIKILTNDTEDEATGTLNVKAKHFQKGLLEIPNLKLAYANAKKIMAFSPYYKGYTRRTFVATMISLFKNPNYSNDEMITKLKHNPSQLYDCTSIGQYKLLLEDIYNFRRRDKVNLRY
jgi:hypothetical protein